MWASPSLCGRDSERGGRDAPQASGPIADGGDVGHDDRLTGAPALRVVHAQDEPTRVCLRPPWTDPLDGRADHLVRLDALADEFAL